MRIAVLGALVGAGLVIAAMGPARYGGEALAQRADPYASATRTAELVALSATVGDKYQQITVIDPKLRVMSVYRVDLASGSVELRCVRNIHWDLQMDYYNGNGLSPQEIRLMLEPR